MKTNSQAVSFALLAVILWSTVATAFKKSLLLISPFDLLLLSSSWSVLILFILLTVRYKGFSGFALTHQKVLALLRWRNIKSISLLSGSICQL